MATTLLIDDHRRVRDALSAVLEDAGHDVIAAEDGRAGLREASRRHIDLVVTDILMPERDGFEVVRDMRQLKPDVPVIVLSGGGSMRGPDLLRMARQLSADVTLSKPVDNEELLSAVNYLLSRRMTPPASASLSAHHEEQ